MFYFIIHLNKILFYLKNNLQDLCLCDKELNKKLKIL